MAPLQDARVNEVANGILLAMYHISKNIKSFRADFRGGGIYASFARLSVSPVARTLRAELPRLLEVFGGPIVSPTLFDDQNIPKVEA